VGVFALGLAVVPAAAAADVITSLSAIPNPFSPNGDGMLDQTTIHSALATGVDSLRLTVRSEAGTQTWTLGLGLLAAGSHSWVWDGKTSAGETFADGIHRLIAVAYSGGAVADSVTRLVSTDVSVPRIVNFQAIRSSFAPDAQLWNVTGVRFGVETGGPAADTTRVRVLNSSGSSVVTLGGFRGARQETTFYWDGKNASGAVSAEGTYSFEVRAADEAENTHVQAGLVYLDRGAPSVKADPDTLRTTAFPDTLRGQATDPSGVESVFARKNPGAWGALSAAPGDTVRWEYVFDDTSDADGWYTVFVRARDIFGHQSDSLRVVIGKAGSAPVHVQSRITSPDTIFANGDTVRIETEWDRAGYRVRANFLEVDSKYTTGKETVVDEGDGRYWISYKVNTANTHADGLGLPIRITATHIYRVDTAFVWVELRNASVQPPPTDRLSLDRNLFNPEGGEDLTISFPSTAPGDRIEIYTLMGERVWSRGVGGLTFVVWDGRNSEGDVVASGVYLVRLGEDVRKIGVVK
jgi:flagellar hook assembly protein FlgD